MGLDMYLIGHHYNTAYVDDVPRPMLDNKYHIESTDVDLGYWRKHADLHGYIVDTFAKGIDNCMEIELSEDDLDKIILAIQNDKLEKDHSGFFFGNSTDNGYYEKKKKNELFQFFKEQRPFARGCKDVKRFKFIYES